MFDVIEFLDHMGQDAERRYASSEQLEFALADAQVDPALRAAILARDQRGLEGLLGYQTFCCFINPGKQDEDEEECDGSCKDGDEKDDDEGGEEDTDDKTSAKR